jgi:thiaminase/transcriptional activator TenA
VVDEIQLHSAYAAQWGVDVSRVTPTPACSRYVDFLLLVARDPNNGIAACAAAMVPCMRLYAHLGRALDAQAKAGDVALALANPYREWIAAYSDDGFEALAARLEALLDRHTASAGEEEVARLRALYVRAMELELGFFDGWSPQRVNTQPDEL